MARKSKKKETKFRKLFRICAGFFLMAASIVFYLSFFSYHASDPSFNHVSDDATQNLLGGFGANIAEAAWCFYGIALCFFVPALFVWGFKLVRYGVVLLFKFRLLAFIMGVNALAPLLNIVHTAKINGQYLGGKTGEYFLRFLNTHFSYAPPVYRNMILIFILGIVSVLTFNAVMGLTAKSWWKFFKAVLKGAKNITVALFALLWAVITRFKGGKKTKAGLLRARIEPKLKEKPVHQEQKASQKTLAQKAKLPAFSGQYRFPSSDLLSRPKDKGSVEVNQKELDLTAQNLENVLKEFGVYGEIVAIRPGPVVTLFEFKPVAGTKTARVIGLADDIARSMCAVSARIAVVAGTDAIGIEIPNAKRETVWFKDLIEDEAFAQSKNTLNVVLGKDIGGQNVYADLAKMPHLLVAGTTGSGKSVGINSMILSLLFKMTPEECKMIMIDPKMLEFSMYNDIPHLLTPVITDPAKAVVGLKWAVCEMEERYRKISDLHVRNIFGYNQKLKELQQSGEKPTKTIQVGFDAETGRPIYEHQEIDLSPMPYIVIVVDEVADLMIVAKKEVETAIQRLAQKARAAGIHLIMATQRPSVDVITGVIKANFPTRISFQVTSKFDSMTILGDKGAEQLLGMGDMLYMPSGLRPLRVHGSFVKDSEVEAVAEFLKSQGAPNYVAGVTEGELTSKEGLSSDLSSEGDADLYMQALNIVRNDKKASTSYIQRKLRIGYNRAAALIDKMEEDGIVSPADHVGRREVIG